MARYIVKRRITPEVVAAAARGRMQSKDRVMQIAAVKSDLQAGNVGKRIDEWFGDVAKNTTPSSRLEGYTPSAMASLALGDGAPRSRASRPARGAVAPPTKPAGFPMGKGLTGAVLLDLSQEAALKLASDLSDVDVIEDRRLTLIEPVASSATSNQLDAVGKPWLWVHDLVRVSLTKARGVSGKGVTVAVLDTGVDGKHAEFAGRKVSGVTFDVASGTTATAAVARDTATHGTHVAGIIGGKTVGIAPEVTLIGAEMIPNGSGWISDFIIALDWAASVPEIQIVNMSAGLAGFHPEMLDSVRQVVAVGLLPVIATGNEGRNTSRSPGNYDAPLSVGACDRNRQVASFSGGGTIVYQNQQYVLPDVVAPGVDVYSAVPGGYALKSGTSMATPVVSGMAALLLEMFPNATVGDLIDAIISGCDDVSRPNFVVPKDRQGRGLVNFEKAMAYWPG